MPGDLRPEMTGDSRLHFAVLGAFRVDRDGLEVDPGPRLQRMLLAILVVEARHVVPVDRLIDLLWRDEPPAAAMASVQAYVSQLRRLLEPGRPARAPARVLVTQDPGYLLRVDDDQLDAMLFQALARQARSDLAGGQPAAALVRLEDALALWRGDPQLRGRLRQAASGHGGAVVLIGEPGAGKTTLAEAAARLAAADGITAAWGRCPDAASTPAYWPWSQVLRALPTGPQVQTARQRLDGDLAGDEEESVRQFRAYQAVAAALGEAAADTPLLAVIDDLHAADHASLALLQLLAGDLHRMPALFLFTVRDTEPSRAVGQALGELLRHPGGERMAVGAFAPADVAALLERLTAEPPDRDVIAALIDRTGGNPFYTTELVRLVSSEHRRRALAAVDVRALDVPSGIRDVLLRRIGRLPSDTQSLLLVAAVAGREIQPELLERVTGLDPEHLLVDLEPAVAAGLVIAAEAGWGFRFRHPLIHESLYAIPGRVDRARLHARVGAALEGISSASSAADVAQLAHHYLSAGPFGDPAKAVRYAREAAARAADQGAWQDAARLLEQVLAASRAGPDADAVRCDVLVELGRVRRSAGRIREAHRAFEESISLADRVGDEDRMLAAAVAFGAPQLWGPREWGETDTGLIALLERQLDRIAEGDPARRIRILATLATELYFDQAAFRGWRYANQALDEARRLGRPEELGIAVSAYLLSATVLDQLPQMRAVIAEMLQGDQAKLTPLVETIVRANLLTERIRSGELARFDAEFPQVWQLATDVLHSPELQEQLRATKACRYLAAGDTERGSAISQVVLSTLQDPGNPWREPQRIVVDSCMMLLTGTLADHAERPGRARGPAGPPVRAAPRRSRCRAGLHAARRPGAGAPDRVPLVRATAVVMGPAPGDRLLGPGRRRARLPRPPVAV